MPDGSPNPANSSDPMPDKNYYNAVEPNQMTYTDGQGLLKTMHIPKGRNQEAGQYLLEKNWDALAHFPDWSM